MAVRELPSIEYHPLTTDRWADFEQLFGNKGAVGGCWCMFFRMRQSEFNQQSGEGNRQAMKAIVETEEVPGILAYFADQPVGWCSIAPREVFSRLSRSRILAPVDDQPVWSLVCFYINKKFRRQGVMQGLIQASVDYVRQQGGKIVEAYPVDPKKGAMPDVFAYVGLKDAFHKAGFQEVARRSETRPILRLVIPHPLPEA